MGLATETLGNDLAGSSGRLRWDRARGAAEGRGGKSSLGSGEHHPAAKVRAGLQCPKRVD